jgi:crossover junction endodeoxyribonuclease RuvC
VPGDFARLIERPYVFIERYVDRMESRAGQGPRITLGIDPGTAILGYAIVSSRANALSMIVCDVITTPAGMPLAQRLQQIYQGLSEVIATYQPNEAAMEELFFAKNARTALTVGHARGVAMLALANGGLTVAEYTPKQVKQAVTGYGSADKVQVGEMVRILLNLRAVPRPDDAADAAAVAICHLNTVPLLRERSANPWEGRF